MKSTQKEVKKESQDEQMDSGDQVVKGNNDDQGDKKEQIEQKKIEDQDDKVEKVESIKKETVYKDEEKKEDKVDQKSDQKCQKSDKKEQQDVEMESQEVIKEESKQNNQSVEVVESCKEPQSLKFCLKFMDKDQNQVHMAQSGKQMTIANPPNLLRRFKINLRLISPSHKNKICSRLQDIDKMYVCRRTKEQRERMGKEFKDINLLDVYLKNHPHRIKERYGQQFKISVDFRKSIGFQRTVKENPQFSKLIIDPDVEKEEEEMLDEQKVFQSLHDSLEQLIKKYNKTTEYVSELFVRVCGDLKLVEDALQDKEVPQWTYLEDLALTKSFDTQEYQWLVKSKGQKEILKRRKFLMTADCPDEGERGQVNIDTEEMMKYKKDLEEEDLMHDPHIDESVPFLS